MNELERKIYNGEHLTEQELHDAVFTLNSVDASTENSYLGIKIVRSIIKVEDKLFCIEWKEGEGLRNFFSHQPFEVEETEYTITVKDYIRKYNKT